MARTALLLAGAAAALAGAQAASPLRGFGSSQEIMLPMRDGVKLHTMVDFPIDKPKSNLTVVMDRSPYGEWAIEMLADIFTAKFAGDFAAVRQDMRGTKQSEGQFDIWHSAANDSYDTMQWISEQPWSSGVVYGIGASADGLAEFMSGFGQPKWLHAEFIIFASSVGYKVAFPGSAFRQALDVLWMNSTVPDQAARLIAELKAQESFGPWWHDLTGTGQYWKIKWPSVMFAGWYDIFLDGNLIGFEGYQHNAAPGWTGKSKIVIDPLGHCQAGSKYFKNHLIAGRIPLPVFLAFDMYKGENTHPNVKAVTFYIMSSLDSTVGNYWTSIDEFPAFTSTPYYMSSDGSLSTAAPTATGAHTYAYDPSNPAPTIGGNNLKLHCGPLDQTPKESRDDVNTYTTAALTDAVWLTGPITATLYVESSAVDTDFAVSLSDVYPTGESRLIQDGIQRMRYLETNTKPMPITPGKVYEVEINMWNTSYVFDAGHKIRVSVSSSNYPRFSANPNNGLPLSKNGTMVVANNTVHFSPTRMSRINLPLIANPKQALPEVDPFFLAGMDPNKPEDVAAYTAAAHSLIEMADKATGGMQRNEAPQPAFVPMEL